MCVGGGVRWQAKGGGLRVGAAGVASGSLGQKVKLEFDGQLAVLDGLGAARVVGDLEADLGMETRVEVALAGEAEAGGTKVVVGGGDGGFELGRELNLFVTEHGQDLALLEFEIGFQNDITVT